MGGSGISAINRSDDKKNSNLKPEPEVLSGSTQISSSASHGNE
jgi:hypothetical protein